MIVCPACGEEERLNGRPRGDLIAITCEACGLEWERDPKPRCPKCDGDEMEGAVQAIVEKSRGTQLSIMGTRVIHLCRQCDKDVLERYLRSRSPLMPGDLPT